MAEFEEKLQSILGNPELMGQIMSMAGAMNQQPPPPPPPPQNAGLPFDPSAMAGMMQMLKATQLEPKQRQLIQALRSAGYTRQEVAKLLPDPAQPLEDALEQIETSLRERQSQLTLLLVQVRQMRARQQEG